MRRALRALALPLGLALALVAPPASADGGSQRGDWRFRDDDKTVKVVVVGGSISAKRRTGYSDHIRQQCSNVELKNLGVTGAGAGAIKKHFRNQVIKNRRVKLQDERFEYWVLHHGGVNSILTPDTTASHYRETFVLAHEHGMKVLAFTLLPWGTPRSSKFQGAEGVRRFKASRQVAQYLMGQLSPEEALGNFTSRREDPEAPWQPQEEPDIRVNLWDGPLRDAEAEPFEADRQRKKISKDSRWKSFHRKMEASEREADLAADTQLAVEMPRWFMKRDLHSFDHVHPNAKGHWVIFNEACPKLPESWGCTCPSPGPLE